MNQTKVSLKVNEIYQNNPHILWSNVPSNYFILLYDFLMQYILGKKGSKEFIFDVVNLMSDMEYPSLSLGYIWMDINTRRKIKIIFSKYNL